MGKNQVVLRYALLAEVEGWSSRYEACVPGGASWGLFQQSIGHGNIFFADLFC